MVEHIQAPPLEDLLPPLLAHLPTAFASPQPPPSLIPLLSPILRQRVQLLSSNEPTRTWIPLLCWSPEKGADLVDIVKQLDLEFHPVTGEIELGDASIKGYTQVDEETLRAKIVLPERRIEAIYLWCHGVNSEGKNEWLINELTVLGADQRQWHDTIEEANRSFQNGSVSGSRRPSTAGTEDDDDYWGQYDDPSGTPAPTKSPRPQILARQDTTGEDEYYARYGSVQPALDADEPSEHTATANRHTNGHTNGHINGHTNGHYREMSTATVQQPVPRSPSSKSSLPEALEEKAASQLRHETGVKQHISTSIKSLYRLARISGIESGEFEELVTKELEVLALMEEEA
jgi:hypothetical protein